MRANLATEQRSMLALRDCLNTDGFKQVGNVTYTGDEVKAELKQRLDSYKGNNALLKEMEETALAKSSASSGKQIKDSLLRRKYVIPFVLACVILFCNTATGINSIVAYNTNILLQSQCALDQGEHLSMPYDHIADADVLTALDPAQPQQPACTPVLPVIGG